ncbi:MAG: transcriptional repressor [Candidatus Zixiibacteriota bacterium]|nr:MAG: transcriptional repressor [candidate division Zixibacteria bacterium]
MQERRFQRNSHQRNVILEELRNVKSHPTAATLYKLVRKRLPKISLGTIYRNLDLLSKKGIIQKLEVGGSEAHFDGDTDQHYHICCTVCGKIDDIHDFSEKLINVDLLKIKGYDIKGYHMNFYGICPDCQENH